MLYKFISICYNLESISMNSATTVQAGNIRKPAAIFIHGLGMDKMIWERPDESRVLGGRFPLSFLVCGEPEAEEAESAENGGVSRSLFFGKTPKTLATLFQSLREQEYTVIAWSQRRPSAEIDIAATELRDVINSHEQYCKSGIVLVGHSRGGLVARKYLAEGAGGVRAVITLATPHRGSRMAQWVKYITPLISLVNPLLPDSERGTLTYAVKRVFDFLRSRAVRELLPDSPFFKSFRDVKRKDVYYLSLGGCDPTLFSVYRRVVESARDGGRTRSVARVKRVFALPDILERVIPERLFPDEMKRGMGDGLVSAESARFPLSDEHYDFPVNHAGILFDERAKQRVLDGLTRLL
jgi:pimeloyl-ACP methyl ester carboxylesterase